MGEHMKISKSMFAEICAFINSIADDHYDSFNTYQTDLYRRIEVQCRQLMDAKAKREAYTRWKEETIPTRKEFYRQEYLDLTGIPSSWQYSAEEYEAYKEYNKPVV